MKKYIFPVIILPIYITMTSIKAFDGLSVGIGAGLTLFEMKNPNKLTNPQVIGQTFKHKKSFPMLGARMTYARSFSWFVPQVTLSYMYSPIAGKKTFDDFNLNWTERYNLKHNGSFDIKPGVKVHDRLCLYPLIGMTVSQFEHSLTLNNNGERSRSTQTRFGWNFGLGGRFLITEKFDVDAEFKYTKYRNKIIRKYFPLGFADQYWEYRPKIKAMSFTLGINYRF